MIRSFFAAVTVLAANALAGVSFDVSAAAGTMDAPRDGRVVVYVVGPDRPLADGESPAEWDYCHESMPVYARDAVAFGAGKTVVIDATADHFKVALDALASGRYEAQAVFDWHRDASGWQMEPGNLASDVVEFDVKPGANAADIRVPIELRHVVPAADLAHPGVALVEVRSKLLSDFRGRDVTLRAGVVLPTAYDPAKRYAAIYEVPGFGGTHADAIVAAGRRAESSTTRPAAASVLAARAFHVYLDPESPNGHTLLADSDVNGPCGRALVEELIPAIERQFPALVAEPSARLLTGHSSGGWSVCWLQTRYDAFFGGAWPSSPDPLDFRRFEQIDLYADANLYEREGRPRPSVRDAAGRVTLHVGEENAWEACVAPDNRGGQQWQSWQAVFGLPRGDGAPRPLYDVGTGAIDRAQLDHYRRYDLSALLRAEPAKYAPIWRQRIRLIVGDADDYYLHEAVALLAGELAKLPATGTPATNRGYVKIVPGRTHDTIYDAPEMAAFDREMLEHLDAHGH